MCLLCCEGFDIGSIQLSHFLWSNCFSCLVIIIYLLSFKGMYPCGKSTFQKKFFSNSCQLSYQSFLSVVYKVKPGTMYGKDFVF